MRDWSNGRAGWLLIAGAFGIAWRQRRRWRRDAALLARLAGATQPAEALDSWPGATLVSVLTAAWNERDVVGAHIASFQRLHYPYRELLLCAGGEDGTYEAATATGRCGSDCGPKGGFPLADGQSDPIAPFPKGPDNPGMPPSPRIVVLDQQPGEGKQRALQRCFEQSRGEVVFLTDTDCLLDDESFEATLRPLLMGREAVTTGTSMPMSRQLESPFVRSQWAVDRYVDGHRPRSISGLLGRNAAVRRDALEAAGAFTTPVCTGTDYHLAKRLLARGYRIRRVDDSAIETRYAETWSAYRRQQARWLRNVVMHGVAFGAHGEALHCIAPSVVGVAMLSWPLTFPLLGWCAVVVWLLAWMDAIASRARYAMFAGRLAGRRFGYQDAACLPLFAAFDFAVWAMALLDYSSGRGRARW